MSCLITLLAVLVKEARDNCYSQLKEGFEHEEEAKVWKPDVECSAFKFLILVH